MKSSLYYQRWLQVVSRGSDILLFLMGYFLGKEDFSTAIIFLCLKVVFGFVTSELVYKRMKAVVEERKKVE